MKKLLSGVKPTGRPHLGNYFGAMRQFVDLQNEYNSNVFIADFHALTSVQDKNLLEKYIIDEAIDYLAIGLDPKKTRIFKQSDLPEVCELAWIFECLVSVPYLMRAHAYKDAETKNSEINVGIFNYPILMAADILIHNADIVPVGSDQKQHVEYARDIANKFNKTYGDTFKLPKELIIDKVKTVPGLDGKKMSKSHNNTIPLFAEDDEIRKLVMKIPTDSLGVDEPKNPDESIIFQINSLLLNEEDLNALRKRFISGGLGYKEAKEGLIRDLTTFISPLRESRAQIAKDSGLVLQILKKGGEIARSEIQLKMDEVRKKIGIKIY